MTVPGETITGEEPVTINEGRETATLTVANTGDRPVQVGSHTHFAEVNAALRFDRGEAVGMRLNVPAGTAVRFEPGTETTVDIVALGGKRRVQGLNGLTDGSVEKRERVLARVRERGFADTGSDPDDPDTGSDPDDQRDAGGSAE